MTGFIVTGNNCKKGRGHETKLSLAQSFVELAESTPIDDITINMIVERSGKHNKTFYYHFATKSDLVIWLFRYELALELEAGFAPDQLVFESPDGAFPEFAFYARCIDENDRIYNAPFFGVLYRCFERRRAYYRNVFSDTGPETLERYLLSLYQPAISDDINYLINRNLTSEKKISHGDIRLRIDRSYSTEFLAEFFTGAFVSRYIQRLNYASVGRTAEEISPFENVIHDSLGWLVYQGMHRDVEYPSF